MDRATFFKHFDLLADQSDAVAKMRELIWQLAVQGKLLSQNPKDEPATGLVEKIRERKSQLIKAGKIRKTPLLPPIEVSDHHFNIPPSWAWVHLNDIGDWGSGSTPERGRSEFYGGDIPWLKSGELNDGYITKSEEHITKLALEKCSLRLDQPGDVLVAMYGATVGKVAILEIEATTNQAVCACTCFDGVFNRYLFLLLKAYKQRFIDESAGAAQPNFSKDKIIRTVVPLPPLAEQRRIVAKVDELMALCDELEQQQQVKHDAEILFHRSVLHHLTSARDRAAFATSWQRVSNHFDLLHDHPDAIIQLRQSILELAVQGHFGTQNQNDEAASRLIAQARTQWPERKASERQDFKPEEPPYDLPAGWEWTCLDELGNTNPRNEAGDKLEVAFTPMKFIAAEYGRPAAFEIRPWSEIKKGFTHFANNDVVLAKITPCFENGKSAVMRGLKNGIGAGTTELHVFRGYDGCVLPDYVLLFLKTSHFIETGVPRMTGSAGQKRVPWDYFANSPFPLPPLAEQKRIVAMVNNLMQQCDALELQLNDSRTLGTQLLDSTIHHLFVKPEESELAASSGGRKK